MDRNSALAEAASILQKSNFTKEDSSRVTSLLEFSDRLTDKDGLRRAVMAQRDHELGRTVETPEPRTDETREFRDYLMATDSRVVAELERQQARALSTVTTAGGYLVPAAFSRAVEIGLGNYDQIFDACSVFETSTGD